MSGTKNSLQRTHCEVQLISLSQGPQPVQAAALVVILQELDEAWRTKVTGYSAVDTEQHWKGKGFLRTNIRLHSVLYTNVSKSHSSLLKGALINEIWSFFVPKIKTQRKKDTISNSTFLSLYCLKFTKTNTKNIICWFKHLTYHYTNLNLISCHIMHPACHKHQHQ